MEKDRGIGSWGDGGGEESLTQTLIFLPTLTLVCILRCAVHSMNSKMLLSLIPHH